MKSGTVRVTFATSHFDATEIAHSVRNGLLRGYPLLRSSELDVETVPDPEALRSAAVLALAWLEGMRIVPGGERERLQNALRGALGMPLRIRERAPWK